MRQSLAEGRFDGAEFLLDTNVVIACLIKESRHHRSILELLEIAERLKISLHVTEITLQEFDALIGHHISYLSKLYDEVPDELVRSTRNVFCRDYRSRKARGENISPEEFLASLKNPRSTLLNDWGIAVLDDPIEKDIKPEDMKATKRTLARAYKETRHTNKREKPEAALVHDAHVYYVVLAERDRYGEKTAWLLTLDSSLPVAARMLQGTDRIPFCMSLDGFLQIMSPYVRADHQQSFAEMYTELVARNLFPPEEVIDLEDFAMFADFDLSVRALPAEEVKMSIRQVKKELKGQRISEANRQQLAYVVQKAITVPMRQYQETLESEVRERDYLLKDLRKQEALTLERHEREKAAIQDNLQDFQKKARQANTQLMNYEESLKRWKFLTRVLIGAFVFLPIGLSAWFIPAEWLESVRQPVALRLGISLVSCVSFLAIATKTKLMTWLILLFAAATAVCAAWGPLF